MGKYIEHYCSNDYKELQKLVDKILSSKFSHISQMDYDDFYSIGGQVVWQCEENFDETKGAQFETYLINCLTNKIKTRITYSNRKKRRSDKPVLSIEKAMDDEERCNLKSQLKAYEKPDILPLTQRYLDSLPRGLRQIVELMMEGYNNNDIKKILGLSDKQFNMAFERMKNHKSIEYLEVLKERLK